MQQPLYYTVLDTMQSIYKYFIYKNNVIILF